MVNQNRTTLAKTQGELGLKKLHHSKHSLIAKNVVSMINGEESIWTEVLKMKYGSLNLWNLSVLANCSWFYRDIYKTADVVKSCFWNISINPNDTSFLYDPWLFEIPLAYKPTFLNMTVAINQISLLDFYDNQGWNWMVFEILLGLF